MNLQYDDIDPADTGWEDESSHPGLTPCGDDSCTVCWPVDGNHLEVITSDSYAHGKWGARAVWCEECNGWVDGGGS